VLDDGVEWQGGADPFGVGEELAVVHKFGEGTDARHARVSGHAHELANAAVSSAIETPRNVSIIGTMIDQGVSALLTATRHAVPAAGRLAVTS
jgi:hypothetical protein